MNIHEDLMRDDVEEPAKAVLFGNGHRLVKPEERAHCFSQKCIISAERYGIALVQTSHLFGAARYVSISGDKKFAKNCRLSLVNGVGITTFPILPDAASSSPIENSEE